MKVALASLLLIVGGVSADAQTSNSHTTSNYNTNSGSVNTNSNSKPYQQDTLDQYNVLRFLGTASPFTENPGFGITRDAPSTCNVTQAHSIARHGERYPTASKGASIASKLERIRNITEHLTGPLAFLTSYDYPGLNPSRYDSETDSGPYSGLNDLYNLGKTYRTRYDDLYEQVEDKENFKFYSASEQRVVDSALKFAQGFLGKPVDNSTLYIIDEDDESLGANSLTPVTSCLAFNSSLNDDLVAEYSDNYKKAIAKRFNLLTPGLEITHKEVGALLDYCGFDLNVAGRSQICELFTTSELLSYSYSNDLSYYYSKGPGNNITAVVGSVYIDAVIDLLKEDEIPLTLSFAHDTDLFMIYSALGLFDGDLPVDHIEFTAQWKTSNLAPMGAHLIFERLECDDEDDAFVRIVVNDAVIPIPGYGSGPGFSVSIDDFEKYITNRLDGRVYAEDCEIPTGAPGNLTFFWN